MTDATHEPTQVLLDAQRVALGERKPEEQEKEKQQALAKLTEHQSQMKKAAAEKRDKLLAVQIDRTEAATLALEFGIAKEAAENVLREHGGDFEATVTYLLTTKPMRRI